jgi:hypothetical protein
VHWDVPLAFTVAGAQLTATDVTVCELAWTLTFAIPDFVVSWVLVAVTVTLPAEAGAVKVPIELMPPPPAVHVTEEL